MKRFVIYILIFAGLVLLSDLLLVILTKGSMDEEAFKIPPNRNILVLGDSQLECAINDSIVTNAVNLCHSGEAYVYTYTKMKILLDKNPQIDTVLLSFNFHSLLSESESWIEDKNGVLNIDRYCSFFGNEEQDVFGYKANFYKSLFRIPYTYRHFIRNRILSRQNSYENLRWGGYYPLDKNLLKEDIKQIDNYWRKDPDNDYSSSSSQMTYLNKIVDHCKMNDVCLIFINSPVYSDHIDKKEAYHQFYTDTFSDIPLWDYSLLSLPDYCYADIYHLNMQGAEIFSRVINDRRRTGE